MRHKTIFVYICVLICFFIIIIFGVSYRTFHAFKNGALVEASISEFEIEPSNETIVDGCIIMKQNDCLFIYVPPDSMWSGIWGINPSDTKFISHDDSIVTHTDLRLGMMLRFLPHDEVIQSIFPTPLYDVEYIETWGSYNAELYEAGINYYNNRIPP